MFIALVDPFDTLPLSLPLDRAPIVENQRYTYPALARKPDFDSAVIGTSTSRLLDPDCLDDAFGAAFVNLAMNSAEAWEQAQLLRVFLRHHPRPKVVVLGLDGRWLDEGAEPPRTSPHYVFPPWLYDEDPWNDYLHLFDRWTLQRARRQLVYALTGRGAKYGRNGYRDFLPDFGAYDPVKVAEKLYGEEAGLPAPVDPPVRLDAEEADALSFPTHGLLATLLVEIPAETQKVLFFPPYHAVRLGPAGGRQDAVREISKARIAELVRSIPRARLIDFQLRTALTRTDANFWDPVHVTQPVAEAICRALAESRGGVPDDASYRILVPDGDR